MLKIGLFSKLSRVSIRMLRYYDEIGLLHPAYIDPESDYRYYREDQLPQIGWNALHIVKDDPLFKYIREGEYVYYVHSYYGKNCTESTLAVSDYSIPVTGAVRAGRVYGTQFHPEKSGDTGLRILKAFAEL